eukprot:123359_1
MKKMQKVIIAQQDQLRKVEGAARSIIAEQRLQKESQQRIANGPAQSESSVSREYFTRMLGVTMQHWCQMKELLLEMQKEEERAFASTDPRSRSSSSSGSAESMHR